MFVYKFSIKQTVGFLRPTYKSTNRTRPNTKSVDRSRRQRLHVFHQIPQLEAVSDGFQFATSARQYSSARPKTQATYKCWQPCLRVFHKRPRLQFLTDQSMSLPSDRLSVCYVYVVVQDQNLGYRHRPEGCIISKNQAIVSDGIVYKSSISQTLSLLRLRIAQDQNLGYRQRPATCLLSKTQATDSFWWTSQSAI